MLPDRARRSAHGTVRLPDRDGQPQPPPLPGHGPLQEPGPNDTLGRLGRGRRRAKRRRPLRRSRHAPARDGGRGARPGAPRRASRRSSTTSKPASPKPGAASRRRASRPRCRRWRGVLSNLRAARGAQVRDGDGGTAMLLDEKIALAEGALAAAAEVTLDAVSAPRDRRAGRGVRGDGVGVERRGRRRSRSRA